MALAEGIVRVANANMERAIRVVSVQRGFDPREFALLAFGGAGGMHACQIAERLDILTVIVPKYAGVLSALGMLLADVTRDYSRSILTRTETLTDAELMEEFEPIVARARDDLRREGFEGERTIIERLLDVRYVGQSYEITVPFHHGYRDEFDRQHARLYGYSNPRRATEVVNLRIKATGITSKPVLPRSPLNGAITATPYRVASAWFAGRETPTALYRWEDLEAGATALGPAVIAGGQATTVVPPGFTFRIDEFGNVVADRTVTRAREHGRGAALEAAG